MSVVGIDFGYDTCYISVARAGGIETIANDYSMRDTPAVVGFADKQRIMGVGAKSQMLTNVKKTFFGFKPLLGRQFDDPVVQEERARLPYEISRADNGGVLIHVDYQGKKRVFTVEQIAAMMFTKLKETADVALQTKVKDVVISVPSYYTDRERRALLDAATIAGLHVLKLMNETTATSLAYGIYKQDLPATEEKARNVVFVDCGHRGIQVSAASFNKGKLVMQACSFNGNCGGRAFNEALTKYMAEDFKKRYKIDPYTNSKALLKLVSEVEKLKKQMSANTNKLPLNIECFMNDKDVTGSIDRATFEELVAPQLQSIEDVMKECLTATKWKLEDIHSVEIVGGSSRVPAIKNLIEKIFGKTPNTTLNADEAVSRGCALQCAILSPTFKVKEFSVTDIQPFPIKVKWQTEGDEGEMVAFPKFHAVPFSKMLSFYRREDFKLEGEYDGSAPLPDQHIGVFEIGEVKPLPDGSSPKIKVKIRVNLHGIFTVASASLVEKHEVEEEVPMEVDPPKEDAKKGEENDKEESQDKEAKPETGDETMEAQEGSGQSDTETAKSPKVKTEKRKKTISKTIDLPVTGRSVGSLLKDKLEEFTEVEHQLTQQDKQEAERLTAKNTVEEYIYDIRSKLHEQLAEFISEDDRSKFSLELEDSENWLYEDGENCEKQVYVDKLGELKLKGEPVKTRKHEFDNRPAAIDALGHAIQMAEKIILLYRQGDEAYAHLDKAEVEKAVKIIDEKRKWMDEHCAAIAKLSKTVNPNVLAVQFINEKKALEQSVNPILNKAKPRVEPPPKEEKAADKAKEEKTEEAQNGAENGDNAAPVNGEQGQMDLD